MVEEDRAVFFAMGHLSGEPASNANYSNWFSHKMLAPPFRYFVINQKDKLRKVIKFLGEQIIKNINVRGKATLKRSKKDSIQKPRDRKQAAVILAASRSASTEIAGSACRAKWTAPTKRFGSRFRIS